MRVVALACEVSLQRVQQQDRVIGGERIHEVEIVEDVPKACQVVGEAGGELSGQGSRYGGRLQINPNCSGRMRQ